MYVSCFRHSFAFLFGPLCAYFLWIGLRYEMSSLIPPQFDHYGTTFWIPPQVEPTVALIGTSLPALR